MRVIIMIGILAALSHFGVEESKHDMMCGVVVFGFLYGIVMDIIKKS